MSILILYHTWLPRAMIFLGSALMVYNIIRYIGFSRRMRWMTQDAKNRAALHLPLVLIVLFLAGYLAEALFGKPDLVIGAILLGGSIFVCIILAILYYIVERVRENERQLAEARQASQAKNAFFFNMSHDIRTPMNAIIGYAQLSRRPGTTPEQTRDYLDKICASGQHLLSIIDDVLEMSRIESGKMELRPGETDLRMSLSDMRDMFAGQMEARNIHFTVTEENLSHPLVMCDRDRLHRALLNLLSNSCKFTPAGGQVSLTLTETGADEETGRYRFRVADTGIGMSADFAARMFDAFERERTSTVSGIQGTGLGMAITRNIVDLMGGDIQVDTAPGKGTVITLSLSFPLLAEGTAVSRCPCGCTPAAEAAPFRGHLLLVEDNPVNREIAELILTEEGFTLDTAENGQEALERLAASRPGDYAAVLMDVQMPVMDGYEATRRIRALPDRELSSVPIIAMTANAFREDIENEKAAGMDAHISKPIHIPEMMEALEKTLNRP